jgi:hypothetical protein
MKRNGLISGWVWALAGFGFLSLSSCQKVAEWMTHTLGSAPSPVPQVSPESPSPVEDGVTQRNSPILQEMYRVVWVMHPPSPSEFGNWLDSINQGASFEGVYNAFTHSTQQRALEGDSKGTASPQALKAFAWELAGLALEFPELPEWSERDSRPLIELNPGEEQLDARQSKLKPELIEFKPLARAEPSNAPRPTREVLAGQITGKFNGASIFILKRVLGDWGLKVVELRRAESKDRLVGWFADFAAATAKYQVSFGLKERNKPERDFHLNWATQSSEDLLRWEVLNRLHRILNEAQPLRLQENTK